jgi:hypothetical protein
VLKEVLLFLLFDFRCDEIRKIISSFIARNLLIWSYVEPLWRHLDTQHEDIQHNNTQHNNGKRDTQHSYIMLILTCGLSFMLTVVNKPFMLSVILLCRYAECRYAECHYAERRYDDCRCCGSTVK